MVEDRQAYVSWRDTALATAQERDEARKRVVMFKEFIDDYKEAVAEHEETIRYWQAEAHRIERERQAALAEIERLREAVRQVHALAEKGRDFAASEAVRDIHKITKGMVTSDANR